MLEAEAAAKGVIRWVGGGGTGASSNNQQGGGGSDGLGGGGGGSRPMEPAVAAVVRVIIRTPANAYFCFTWWFNNNRPFF